MNQIEAQIVRIDKAEHTFACPVIQPHALYGLTQVLESLVSVPRIREKFKCEGLAQDVLSAFLRMRGLLAQRTKLSDKCASLLLQVVERRVLRQR